MAESENSKTEASNTSQEREGETDTQEVNNDGMSSPKQTKLPENEASVEEAKQQNGQAEPAEEAAAEMTTAGTSKGAKRDDVPGKGWGPSQCLHCDCYQGV